MAILSKTTVGKITPQQGLVIPGEHLFNLPEKVIQFGTGVLLRGLPDYYIDKANRQGIFNGRVVIIKSTSQGDTRAFDEQDGLFAHCVKGLEQGQLVEQTILNAAISRVLNAQEQWAEVLACAADPAITIILSNTTEVGISLVKELVSQGVPASYPGKLLALLYHRYRVFAGDSSKGLVIIPTELISDNGKKLKAIVQELAFFNEMEPGFVQWLNQANDFCSSLVDRIVPGKLPAAGQAALEQSLGCTDALSIMSEPYGLWAIETDQEATRRKLSFSQTDAGVVLAADIAKFKELKLRLLNGTHTFSCGLAMLAGFGTVKEAMQQPVFSRFVARLMLEEMAPAITGEAITAAEAAAFAGQVLDRFSNPYLQHQWASITMQYTSKMALRNVPVLEWFYQKYATVPRRMAMGFAAYLLFLCCRENAEGQYVQTLHGKQYVIADDKAALLHRYWQTASGEQLVQLVLDDVTLWGTSLLQWPGFADAVAAALALLDNQSAASVLNRLEQTNATGI